MTLPQAWPRLKEIFEGARALPVDARQAYLAAACSGDDALRQDVESLLASHEQATSFLETPALLVDDRPTGRSLEGETIGVYEIGLRIGVGGMGEVYRAHDKTLNRDVAIKFLLPAVADDRDRLGRFGREARLLASLNHPHIAQVYGLEDASGLHALVMELVEGPTLAEIIARGPIPIDDAMRIAMQLSEALAAAHERGVVHRDFKPANIKIRDDGTVKVLDFGLAKAIDSVVGAGDTMDSPAPGAPPTESGVILGTGAYMSPEQARGRPIDKRTDIWAFGCVLFEMLTGRAPFGGDTMSDILVAILEREPDLTILPADTPLPIRRLLRRCLEKDRKRRLDSLSAARLEVEDAIASPAAETLAAAAPPPDYFAPVTIAALAGGIVGAALVAWIVLRPAATAPALPARFAIAPAPGFPLNVSGLDRDLAVSPDGHHLVYRAGGSNTTGSPLMVRALDRLDAQPVANVSWAYSPFFSPDNRWIGFFENADLKKVSITGGPAITLCQFSGVPLGASWGDDNTITFATSAPDTGLWRVSADGGKPTIVTQPDSEQSGWTYSLPSALPLGRGLLFTMTAPSEADRSVAVLDLKNGRRKTLIQGASDAQYVESGHLVFAAAGALRGVRFDPIRLAVLGDPVTVVDRVMTKPSGAANYAVSRAGTLVYIGAGLSEMTAPRALIWVDRKGHEKPTGAPLRAYGTPRLSPDRTRIAAEIYDQSTDIWIWDLARETLRRLTFESGGNGMSVWTPDSRQIVFESGHAGESSVYKIAADGAGTVERLSTSATPQWSQSITPDGTWVAAVERLPRTAAHIIFLPLTRDVMGASFSRAALGQHRSALGVSPSPKPVAPTWFKGSSASFSPNGRYLAYQSEESGRSEIYIRPFPRVDHGRWQVSTAGGTRPVWARSGRELFYLDASNALTAVPIGISEPLSIGSPAKLFDTKYAEPNPSRHYDVSADGQRFLMLKSIDDPNMTPVSIVLVQHWFEELKQRINGK